MKADDKIGAFFKETLNEYKEDLSVKDVELFNQYIEKRRFFQFKYHRFNVYYAAILAMGFLFNVGMGIYFLKHSVSDFSSQIETKQLSTENNSSTSQGGSKVDTYEKNNNEKLHFQRVKAVSIKANSKHSIEKSEELSASSSNILDSSTSYSIANSSNPSLQPTLDSSSHLSMPKKKNKKTVVIVQKDTIYQVDTLPAKLKKWKIF